LELTELTKVKGYLRIVIGLVEFTGGLTRAADLVELALLIKALDNFTLAFVSRDARSEVWWALARPSSNSSLNVHAASRLGVRDSSDQPRPACGHTAAFSFHLMGRTRYPSQRPMAVHLR
jgi:hypothetical protein